MASAEEGNLKGRSGRKGPEKDGHYAAERPYWSTAERERKRERERERKKERERDMCIYIYIDR